MRLCTLFLQVGVAEKRLPVGKLAALMLRDEATGFAELSWLERRVQGCAEAAGTPCHVEMDDRGDQVLVADSERLLDVEAFEQHLTVLFREELESAVAELQAGIAGDQD